MDDGDLPFVQSSWALSYRRSPHTRKWSDSAYFAMIRPRISGIIGRSTVLIARPVDWSEGILGWLCFEQSDESYSLHYAYVKTVYRRHGIAASLLRESRPTGDLIFTHLTLPGSSYLPASFHFEKLHS